MLRTEIEHLLRFGNAADRRSGDAAALPQQGKGVWADMLLGSGTDQNQRRVELQKPRVGFQVLRCRHRVDDQIEAAGVGRHLLGVARDDHLVGAQPFRFLDLARRRREGDDMRTKRMGKLDPHMA
jgi:hypothetical protein